MAAVGVVLSLNQNKMTVMGDRFTNYFVSINFIYEKKKSWNSAFKAPNTNYLLCNGFYKKKPPKQAQWAAHTRSSGTAKELTINICTECEHPMYLSEWNNWHTDHTNIVFTQIISEQTIHRRTFTSTHLSFTKQEPQLSFVSVLHQHPR